MHECTYEELLQLDPGGETYALPTGVVLLCLFISPVASLSFLLLFFLSSSWTESMSATLFEEASPVHLCMVWVVPGCLVRHIKSELFQLRKGKLWPQSAGSFPGSSRHRTWGFAGSFALMGRGTTFLTNTVSFLPLQLRYPEVPAARVGGGQAPGVDATARRGISRVAEAGTNCRIPTVLR